MLHRRLSVGDVVEVTVPPPRGSFRVAPEALAVALDLLAGGGFEVAERARGAGGAAVLHAIRARTLADTVAPRMRLLVCGLNPSLYTADAGVPYARPGNRFWPAALAAGLVSVDRDPLHALEAHGIGFTDQVKRATPSIATVEPFEFRAGTARVERLAERLEPAAVCIVGLSGWRAAVNRHAAPGWQPGGLGGRPVYVMPSTSGLNAHVTAADLAVHLRAAGAPPPGT
jgi:TDG/mug DNA glycosylase family protein